MIDKTFSGPTGSGLRRFVATEARKHAEQNGCKVVLVGRAEMQKQWQRFDALIEGVTLQRLLKKPDDYADCLLVVDVGYSVERLFWADIHQLPNTVWIVR